jgi:NAD(P)-dependent dehydrogenase (short-subunit alcohol dehydrogenase family)
MKKKTILILGASGLIGESLYQKFKESDFNVLGCDLFLPKIYKKNFYKINASKEKEIKNLIKKIVKNHGNVDVIINAIYPKNTKKKNNFFKQDKKDFLSKINSHLEINFSINKTFVNYFLKNKIKGNIIHISSIYGSFIPRFEIYKNQRFTMPLDYLIAKSSMNYFTKYLSKLLLGSGIVINNISPGGIFENQDKKFIKKYSKFTNNRSMLKTEDLFEIVKFVSENKNLKITGQDFIIDDGFTL